MNIKPGTPCQKPLSESPDEFPGDEIAIPSFPANNTSHYFGNGAK